MSTMGFEGLKFGTGPKELGGSVDLISHYRLWPHHEFFCKKSLPLSISDTHYLRNVVGDREIRRGDGMELDQLVQDVTLLREQNQGIYPFQLNVLVDALHMQEARAAKLSSPDRGIPTAVTRLDNKAKEKHLKKEKDDGRPTSQDLKKHRHRTKDKGDNGVTEKNKRGSQSNGSDQLKNYEKKRRRDGNQLTLRDPKIIK